MGAERQPANLDNRFSYSSTGVEHQGAPTSLVLDAHTAGLKAHDWTYPPTLRTSPQTMCMTQAPSGANSPR